jgi:hypothetical protein
MCENINDEAGDDDRRVQAVKPILEIPFVSLLVSQRPRLRVTYICSPEAKRPDAE